MKHLKFVLLIVFCLALGLAGRGWAETNPVAMLTQAQGTVEYSKDGAKWKAVSRNKLLSEGEQVRTAADGSAKLINQTTSTVQDLGANSVVKITANGIEKVSGSLSEPAKTEGDLLESLDKRFAKAQRYTTVRRSVDKAKSTKLETIKEIALSTRYPDLVWSNIGSEYTYELVIDEKAVPIAAGSGDMIRHKVSGLTPGKHTYLVKVMQNGQEVYAPKKGNTLTWVDGDALKTLEKGMKEMQALAPGDDFMLGAYMEDHGFTVAAMDLYRKYFQANPKDVDMRPMLIKTYHDLNLKDLQKNEAVQYQKMLAEQE
ncbi:MAG: NfeD family protein [Magnetococcales bacterium]|nr:NfeD family protein [Magnetococcales bacterium]